MHAQPPRPLPAPEELDRRKATARAWFERLRDDICAAFEAIEDEATGPWMPGTPAAAAASRARPGSARITRATTAAAASCR